MDNVRCTGREARLEDCYSTSQHDCYHSEDAGLRCAGKLNNIPAKGAPHQEIYEIVYPTFAYIHIENQLASTDISNKYLTVFGKPTS